MGLFNFFGTKKKETSFLKVEISENRTTTSKKGMSPSERFYSDAGNTSRDMKKYNMHYIEAEFVGENGRLFMSTGAYEKPEINRYIEFRKKYKEKADFKTNPYDIVWAFIQSEKLRISENYIENEMHWDYFEHDFKQHEKWAKWRLKHLEIDDERYKLFQESKHLTNRIKTEQDSVIIKELKETKKQLNAEIKIVRERLKNHFEKKPEEEEYSGSFDD